MSRLASRLRRRSDTWRYAFLGGLASVPFSTLGYVETGSELSLSPVLFGGLVAGYLAERRLGESGGVGVRAGLVGSLPVLLVVFDMLTAVSGLSNPVWFSAVLVGMALVVAGLGVVLAAVAGAVGAAVGGWLAERRSRGRRPVPGS